ncbi:alkaline phosphatase D family protein [Tuwongella immobilis]|uniref:PhoD-like phosphatase metallophosphatase domain-containing protein n=1 Tax=Tuwongella immobilis TaxID=692036 RepID=A0A6C2YUK2_9BACT|nr:alkaline phosphatase D family protein [Tuwongella immobilis]VIP04719.1 Alkaline phosphatase OS=Chroococcidiopsis thermalis PCC 7203 GN=Chro_0947 PE=4 SV=1: PhoD [Tuwongella immobilis]VTS06797.1 Alkaline phosphatase OS=Chroococcidiopsis thermalis PCC 7203 GN=Chro_0947 PE=4 SV=1: PhoD [Tuwongella immobilis]
MSRLTRREFAALGGSALLGGLAPGVLRAAGSRPEMPGGVASGDVLPDRAIIWSVTDRPSRMWVQWAKTDRFHDAVTVRGPVALESSGFTAKLDLGGLPIGDTIAYRVWFEDLTDSKSKSEPVVGRLRTASIQPRAVKIVWGGDVAGQGWGICDADGGMSIFSAMRACEPDFFIHSGDTIYADNPIVAQPTDADGKPILLPNGQPWRNRTTPEKAKVAETIAEFRGNYAYNLLDSHVRAFNAAVPQLVQWDDHETVNNWFPERMLEDPRYTVKHCSLLAARAAQAFREYQPIRPQLFAPERIYRHFDFGALLRVVLLDMRSDRGPNTANRQSTSSAETALLGREQIDWIKRTLKLSRATWNVIASDMPIGLMIGDQYQGKTVYEAVSNGDGPALGRELEIAELLQFIHEQNIRNVVWVTADVHYAAAHHYHPDRAQFRKFSPFWEFVAGPLHSGTFGPAALDNTFGPEVRFHSLPPGTKPNRPPSEGLQFFGSVEIDPASKQLTVRLHNRTGKVLHTQELLPS